MHGWRIEHPEVLEYLAIHPAVALIALGMLMIGLCIGWAARDIQDSGEWFRIRRLRDLLSEDEPGETK